jgi:hypothetical protein
MTESVEEEESLKSVQRLNLAKPMKTTMPAGLRKKMNLASTPSPQDLSKWEAMKAMKAMKPQPSSREPRSSVWDEREGKKSQSRIRRARRESDGDQEEDEYVGGYKDGLRDGWGTLTCRNYAYEGGFRAGRFHGFGRYVHESKDGAGRTTYEGHSRNNKYNGFGVLETPKMRYVGKRV